MAEDRTRRRLALFGSVPGLSLRPAKTAFLEPTPANSLDPEVEKSEGFTRTKMAEKLIDV